MLQYTKKFSNCKHSYTLKNREVLGKEGCSFWCIGCSHHTTFFWLLYLGGDKSEKFCTSYKIQPTKSLNFLKERVCPTSVQIVLCISYLQINIIQKYYSVSLCVISIIIVFALTILRRFNTSSPYKRNQMRLLEISTSPFALREPTSRDGKERSYST